MHKKDSHNRNHTDEHGEDNHGVEVTGHEGSFKTSSGCVKDDTPGDQETSQLVSHSSQCLDGSSSSQQKHGSHNDVGQESKDKEGNVSSLSPASTDDFAHGVSRGSNVLKTDGEDTEEKNLDSGTGGIPERTRDTIVPGNVGGLKESGGPSPLGDDNGGGKAGFDHATGGAVDERGRGTLVRHDVMDADT